MLTNQDNPGQRVPGVVFWMMSHASASNAGDQDNDVVNWGYEVIQF
jgi:hypothetical protein